MITEDKVTEIFCMEDDFCKFYDVMMVNIPLMRLKRGVIQATL